MSSDCSFYEHIDLKIKQCRQLTGWILRTFKARDKSTMLILFKSLVLPRLKYGCQLWCPATVNQIRAMESIQRKFTKHIDGLYSLSYKERLIGLHMYSLQLRRERYAVIYVWKIREDMDPNLSPPIAENLSGRRGRMWITNFLNNRKQRVVVDGSFSNYADVESGVPQGTVLGPLLFLLRINDLPSCVNSKDRLFADDCLLYREIKNNQDQIDMQRDLDALMDWGSTWGMKFNAKKCNIMRVSRSRKPLQHFYSIGNEILQEVSDAKYLGIQIDNKLDWNKHISTVAVRGQSKLAFLNRNLKGCPKKLRDTAYISPIRPALEYSCSVWHPHKKSNKDKIEKVQRRAAPFVSNNFRRKASVSEMLHDLGWQSLDGRRQDQRLVLFYKIINGLALVETEDILTPADSRTRKNHSFKFKHLQANCDSHRYSFFSSHYFELEQPSIWNTTYKSLAFFIEKVDSVEGFKLKLKDHTFRSP